MIIKLNDTQLVRLSAAAQREDRCLVASQQLKGEAAKKKVADKLIGAGLVREVKAKAEMPGWRRDEDEGRAYALKLTAAGLKAIAIDEDEAPEVGIAVGSAEPRAAGLGRSKASAAASASPPANPTSTPFAIH